VIEEQLRSLFIEGNITEFIANDQVIFSNCASTCLKVRPACDSRSWVNNR